MHVLSSCFLLIAITLIAPPVESQYDGLGSLFVPADNYFRSGQLHPSYDGRKQELESQARFFFTTLTVTLASTTTTTTSTTTTICTTSTSALKVCTPSGRRRRGVLLSNLGAQGLYYNDQEDEDGEGDIFLRSSPKSYVLFSYSIESFPTLLFEHYVTGPKNRNGPFKTLNRHVSSAKFQQSLS